MFKLATILLALLFASPALAYNELQGETLAKILEMSEKNDVIVEKLNEADTAAMDERTNPRPRPSIIYLLTLGSSVIIALVHNDVVTYSTDPVELEKINKMLGRAGA